MTQNRIRRHLLFLLLVLLIFFNNTILAQNIIGEGELTKTSKSILDMFLDDKNAGAIKNTENVIIFHFKNLNVNTIDTLCIYDGHKESYDLNKENYGKYRGFFIIMKGSPDQSFFTHLEKAELDFESNVKIIPYEYESSLYYYVLYDDISIINRIRSDIRLPGVYYGYPRRLRKE
ncbi:hypothetical protein [Flammeovirga sp. SJP92]|uniref:hypothetical protein n=1 Tax=Flammeovirga sp. SJP92 TaxID=1775430 RepID=UPI0012F818C7|nr:hypothetical protein [Flammeovirga sp. SJP92]